MKDEIKDLLAVAEQIVADVDEASAIGDLYQLYDRMVCNAQDLQKVIDKLKGISNDN
jgi:hypothetical protein